MDPGKSSHGEDPTTRSGAQDDKNCRRRKDGKGERKGKPEESMKNLYAKGKGRIHPHSPADDLAVLDLLPAGILAMTSTLSDEDKQVLAYLVTRSLKGAEDGRKCLCWTSRHKQPQQEEREGEEEGGEKKEEQGSSAAGGVRRPMFECGCFECYTSFWMRWDSSPDGELIHQVIEAFEEHLAMSEKKGKGGRRRRRRERKEKGRKKREEEENVASVAKEEGREVVEAVQKETASLTVEEGEAVRDESHESADPAAGGDGGGGERRRSWPDIIGLFCSRLWNLWSPYG